MFLPNNKGVNIFNLMSRVWGWPFMEICSHWHTLEAMYLFDRVKWDIQWNKQKMACRDSCGSNSERGIARVNSAKELKRLQTPLPHLALSSITLLRHIQSRQQRRCESMICNLRPQEFAHIPLLCCFLTPTHVALISSLKTLKYRFSPL